MKDDRNQQDIFFAARYLLKLIGGLAEYRSKIVASFGFDRLGIICSPINNAICFAPNILQLSKIRSKKVETTGRCGLLENTLHPVAAQMLAQL
jgi:hypothetical protein